MAAFSKKFMLILCILLPYLRPLFCSFEGELFLLDTNYFIQDICNKTRDRDNCHSIFMHNIQHEGKGIDEGLTSVAIDQMLQILYENLKYVQSEKKKMLQMINYTSIHDDKESFSWDFITFFERNYFEMKMGVEEARKQVINTPIRNFHTKKKVDEAYAKAKELVVYEIGNCENMVDEVIGDLFLDTSLIHGIIERNQILGLLIEMFVGASENLAWVQTGDDENEGKGFKHFMFYGWLLYLVGAFGCFVHNTRDLYVAMFGRDGFKHGCLIHNAHDLYVAMFSSDGFKRIVYCVWLFCLVVICICLIYFTYASYVIVFGSED